MPARRYFDADFLRVADFFFEDRRAGLFLEAAFFLEGDFLPGTLPPARRASDSPIAIACLRLFTVLPERPLFSVPRLRSCIAFFTFSPAFLPYLDAMKSPFRGAEKGAGTIGPPYLN
jgi:hypothetical protein